MTPLAGRPAQGKTAPTEAEPGEIIDLRFAIWDTADELYDSTVLIDNFQWSVEPAASSTTKPVPTPK